MENRPHRPARADGQRWLHVEIARHDSLPCARAVGLHAFAQRAHQIPVAADAPQGSTITCEVQFRRSPAVNRALENRNPTAAVSVHGPLHDEFFDSSQVEHDNALFNASRPVQVWTSAPPVRYQNRSGDPEVWSAGIPGTYYCGAFLNASSEYASAGEVPIRVALTVSGTAGEGAPVYVEDETPSPSPSVTDDGRDDGQDAAPDAAGADDDGGLPLWGWLLIALGVLIVVLGLLTRRTVRH